MKYYKEISIPNFDLIVKKCLVFVKSQPFIYFRKVETASYYNLDHSKLKLACPELVNAFSFYDLTINYSAVYIMYHPSHTQPHRDAFHQQARINIPLMNCHGTYTTFYKGGITEPSIHSELGAPREYVVGGDLEICDKVEIIKPTVLRISEVHDILMPENNPVPRINLSLGFEKDPVFLLEE